MDIYKVIAFVAGIMVILSTLPQVFKSLRLREVKDVSLPMFFILGTAQALWLIYGIHLNDLPLIVTNAGSILIVVTNIFLIFKYREK